ncbi:UNVERIFIED_CONTAM: hypothetical protein FKN15_019527 [Acipenser sinensis]
MVKVHLGAVFMPHGLGHLLGIDVHDVGGYPEVRIEDDISVTASGMELLTCVPRTADQIETFMAEVRIEDDISVTASGMELLTCVPRTADQIETFMAEVHNSCKAFDHQASQKL